MAHVSVRSRVAAGMAYLTKHRRSKAWLKKINLEKLDISFTGACVLGQLYGGDSSWWFNILNKAKLKQSQAVNYGFHPGGEYSEFFKLSTPLTIEWRRQIEAALAA